jgi:methylaspartate ammonia-lyase
MYIEKILSCKGLSGYYNKDLQAIKAGATPDGFVFRDPPVTRGFHAITQPGEALSVMLILSDRQVAFGDCIDVVFTGAAGRDPLFKAAEHQEILKNDIAGFLQGRPIKRFKELAESIDSMEVSGRRLHTAVRYGVTQALLDAAAKANHAMMAEIIASEYGCKIADNPIPLLACTPNEQKLNIDKMILKKVPYFPHGSSSNMERDIGLKGEKLLEYVRWLTERINKLRDSDYHPTIHLDVYGTIGEAFKLDILRIAEFIGRMEDACSPFPLLVESPLISDARGKQITLFKELSERLKNNGINAKIIVDEWCNTLEDIKLFAEKKAADIIQIKMPDLGGVSNSIEAVLICKRKGVGAYLGGTVNGTDKSARISAHVALATQADFLLAKPGQGVDEGLMIEYNEMQRTLTLIKNKEIN